MISILLIANHLITVVIQGSLYLECNIGTTILDCIDSIDQILPGASIVISTWEHEQSHQHLLLDRVEKIVYTSFSSAVALHDFENHIMQQVTAVYAGLHEVKTPYVLKLCANMFLERKGNFFCDPGDRLNLLSLADDPVISLRLFALPDCIQFGKVGSLRLFWSMKIDSNSHHFSPEQCFGMAWSCNKHDAAPLIKHQFDINYVDFLYWKDVLESDFNFFIPDALSGFQCSPKLFMKYGFIDMGGGWFSESSRKQFLILLLNKHVLFLFNLRWWKKKYNIFYTSFLKIFLKKQGKLGG